MSTRRSGAAAVAGLTVLLMAGCSPVAPSPSAGTSPSAHPSAAAATIAASDVERAIDGLAGLGIETRVRPSDSEPIAPVIGGPSPVRLLRHQVRNLALEYAAGSGTRGADLDALTAAAGGGPVSALVAGWAASAPTDAARWAASLLGAVRPADPAATVFPTLALVAFVADTSNASSARATAVGRSLTGSMVAGGIPVRLAVATSSDFCAEVSAYLSTALGDLVETDAEPPAWLRQLIDVYAPQYADDPGLLRRTIGAVALMAYATSLARPWTVNLAPDPSSIAYGIEGEDPVQGEIVLTVSSGGDVFAGDVAACASLADAQLASIPIEGSTVIWDSSGLAGHAREVSSITTLDDIASAGLTYETTAESSEAAENGDPVTDQMWVNAWVDRAEMAALAGVVKSILLGEAAGTPAGSTAKALYEAMEPTLNVMMRPSGFALIDVTFHTTKASPSPSASAAQGITGTWDGIWQNDVQWGGASGGFTLTVVQEGSAFSGTTDVTGPTCVRHGTVTGTVNKGHISMGWVAARVRDVAFEGALDRNTMSGTWTAIACDTDLQIWGTWSAAKQ